MPIPKDHEFFPAIMKYLSDGKEHHRKGIKFFAANSFNLTSEERNRVYENSKDNIAEDRAGWGLMLLKETGLVENTRRGYYKITDFGKEIFYSHPEYITYKFLHQYGDFKLFEENYKKDINAGKDFSNFGKDKDGRSNMEEKFISKKDELSKTTSMPKWHEFFPSVMKYLSDCEVHHRNEIKKFAADSFNLTEEERNRTYEGSEENVAENRAGWAISELKLAGLIESPRRGHYRITGLGKDIFNNHPEYLNYKFLHQYGDSNLFEENYRKENIKNHAVSLPTESDYFQKRDLQDQEKIDPSKKIEDAFSEINKFLGDEILKEIMKISDYDFEHLVTKLLIKMGYGSPDLNKNAVTKKSSDGGIDSVVTADRFGFEFICIQAKKWDLNSTVGRPEIQKFLGALVGRSAKKGLFITTAKFSSDAINFAARQLSAKIVLVDGKALVDLMIEYGLGVIVEKTLDVKRIDSDFFRSFSRPEILV